MFAQHLPAKGGGFLITPQLGVRSSPGRTPSAATSPTQTNSANCTDAMRAGQVRGGTGQCLQSIENNGLSLRNTMSVTEADLRARLWMRRMMTATGWIDV